MDREKYYSEYKKRPFEPHLIRFRKKKIVEFIKKYKPGILLEIGCGDRPLFKDFDDFKKMHVVEPNLVFYHSASREAKRTSSKITLHFGTLESQTKALSGEKFDFIVASSLLHEVRNAGALLKCIYKLCHRRTILHVSVPNAYSFHRLLAYEMGLIKNVFVKSAMQKKFHQKITFDKQMLLSLLSRHGFKACDSGSYFIKPFTHSQMQSMFDTGSIDTNVLDGLSRMGKYMPEYGCEIFVNARKK